MSDSHQLLRQMSQAKRMSGSTDEFFEAIDELVRRHEADFKKYPSTLFQEMYHYFRDERGFLESDQWLRMTRQRYEESARVWFRSALKTEKTASQLVYKEAVNAVGVLSDGRSVSASDDGTVILWDQKSGEIMYLAEPIKEKMNGVKVRCLAVAKEANIIFFGDTDGRVWRWFEGVEGSVAEPFIEHGDSVNSVALSADGQVVVSGGEDKIVYRRTDGNVASATPWADLEQEKKSPYIQHGDSVYSVALSADGQVVVSGGWDNIVYRRTDGNVDEAKPWDDLEEQKKSPYIEHGGYVWSVALSADGQVVVSGGGDNIVYRRTDGNDDEAKPWGDLEEEKQSPYIEHGWTVNSVALSADGQVVVSGGRDKIVYRRTDGNVASALPWGDLEEQKKSPYIVHRGTVNSVALSTDGQVVVSGGGDNIVYRRTDGNVASATPWGDLDQEKKSPYIEHGDSVWSVALSADGGVVVTGGKDGIVNRRFDGKMPNAPPWMSPSQMSGSETHQQQGPIKFVGPTSSTHYEITGIGGRLVRLSTKPAEGDSEGKVIQVYLLPETITSLAMANDFENHPLLLVGCSDGRVHLLEVEPWATQRRQEQAARSKDAM